MKKITITITLCISSMLFVLISGCINVDYTGQRYPATTSLQSIAFYDNSREVPKNQYKIIGRAVATAPDSYSSEEIKNKLLNEAQECGADAIQVVDFKRVLVAQQAVPQSSSFDDGPVGTWGRRGIRADGSEAAVDVSGKAVPLKEKLHNRYELKARVLFLRLNSKSTVSEPTINNKHAKVKDPKDDSTQK